MMSQQLLHVAHRSKHKPHRKNRNSRIEPLRVYRRYQSSEWPLLRWFQKLRAERTGHIPTDYNRSLF